MISEYNMLSGLYMEKASTNSVMLYSRLNCPTLMPYRLCRAMEMMVNPPSQPMECSTMPSPSPQMQPAAMLARIGSVMLMVMSKYCVATETTASPYRLYRTKRRPTNSQPAIKIGMLSSTFHTAGLRVSVM